MFPLLSLLYQSDSRQASLEFLSHAFLFSQAKACVLPMGAAYFLQDHLCISSHWKIFTLFLFSSLCQMHFLELLFQIPDPENHFELDFLLQMSWTTAVVIPNQYSLWPSARKADFKKWWKCWLHKLKYLPFESKRWNKA